MSNVVSIIGMHRSGTSAIAGSLEAAGLVLGPVSRGNRFNAKGNREHADIVRLHDQVLSDNGGSWREPPHTIVWTPLHDAWRERITSTFTDEPLWGFKDPRTVLVIDGWLNAIPQLSLIGVFRHPLSVAASLAHRDGMPLQHALDLWRHYNTRLLALHMRQPFPLVCFDAPADVLVQSVAEICERLNLHSEPAGAMFFDPSLRHHRGIDGTLSPALNDTYRGLVDRSRLAG